MLIIYPILKVAHTIADLDGPEQKVATNHINKYNQ